MKLEDLPPRTIDREELRRRYNTLNDFERMVILATKFEDAEDPLDWEQIARMVEHLEPLMEMRARELGVEV